MESKKIIEAARTWLGTKFHHQGRKKGVGVDCIGLVVGVAAELGIRIHDRTDYCRQPHKGELEKAIMQYLKPCSLKAGAVALFCIGKEPQHVGIITEYNSGFGIIHAYAQARKVVEHNFDGWWQQRLAGTFTF
jgi:cell wall-associated NlpC family hydrolase